MNTRIIKQLNKNAKNTIPILSKFMVKDGTGLMVNLDTAYFFTPSKEYAEDGIYDPEYIDKGIVRKTTNKLDEYPEFDEDLDNYNMTIRVTNESLKQLLKLAKKSGDVRAALKTLMIRKIDGVYKLVAADGYILGWQHVETTIIKEPSQEINIPIEFIELVMMNKKKDYLLYISDKNVWCYEDDEAKTAKIVSMLNYDNLRVDILIEDYFFANAKQVVDMTMIPKDVYLNLKTRNFRAEDDETMFDIRAAISEPVAIPRTAPSDSGFIIMPCMIKNTPYINTDLLHKINAKKINILTLPDTSSKRMYIEVIE